jgi:hypothetical protein
MLAWDSPARAKLIMAPAAGLAHVRENCARGQKSAQKVIVQFVIPIVHTELDCGLVPGKAPRQINQNVDPFVLT